MQPERRWWGDHRGSGEVAAGIKWYVMVAAFKEEEEERKAASWLSESGRSSVQGHSFMSGEEAAGGVMLFSAWHTAGDDQYVC